MGDKDIMVVPSIVDFAGMNPVNEAVLGNTVSALIGMVTYGGKRIEHITTNRQGMELLAAECRRGNLDLCHLGDVVEDWVQKEAMI